MEKKTDRVSNKWISKKCNYKLVFKLIGYCALSEETWKTRNFTKFPEHFQLLIENESYKIFRKVNTRCYNINKFIFWCVNKYHRIAFELFHVNCTKDEREINSKICFCRARNVVFSFSFKEQIATFLNCFL